MRLVIAAVGALKSGPERELADRYHDRATKLGRTLSLSPLDLREFPESRAATAPLRAAEEADRLLSACPPGAKRIALDERGQNVPSAAFAADLGRWRDEGVPAICFLIGGADGLAPTLREGADRVLGFGGATWPHQLVRIMLLEQVYRAMTILSGHPYHRA